MELAVLVVGIGEGRCSYHVDRIRSFITRDETLTDAGVHGAVGRAGLDIVVAPSTSTVVSLQGMRHDGNTAISVMEREGPFAVNGNNSTLKRQGFPLALNTRPRRMRSRSVLICMVRRVTARASLGEKTSLRRS